MKSVEHIFITGPRTKMFVDNIKCTGCGSTITKALGEIGLKNILVSPEESSIEFDSTQRPQDITEAVLKLRHLGYPLVDTEEGFQALALKAKSYLSCAIGKLDKPDTGENS